MKAKAWLCAIIMGLVVPGVLFSIGQRFVPKQLTAPTDETTHETVEQTVEQTVQKPVRKDRTISVLLPDGAVTEMNMDTYLVGVVLAEMPSDFEMEALRAQAVVSRTYARKRNAGEKHAGGAVCTVSSCCQAYRTAAEFLAGGGTQAAVGKVTAAVESTHAQVLTYKGALIEATYFSCSGGRTEDAAAVWGNHIPYLQAVDSPGEENATHYTDTVQFTGAEFAARLGIDPKGAPGSWLGSVRYTAGGGVDTMTIGGKSFTGVALRQNLGLRSTAFAISASGDIVTVTTKGFGHRVGMSQYGADAMAVRGSTYRQILAHYYPGTELTVDS